MGYFSRFGDVQTFDRDAGNSSGNIAAINSSFAWRALVAFTCVVVQFAMCILAPFITTRYHEENMLEDPRPAT